MISAPAMAREILRRAQREENLEALAAGHDRQVAELYAEIERLRALPLTREMDDLRLKAAAFDASERERASHARRVQELEEALAMQGQKQSVLTARIAELEESLAERAQVERDLRSTVDLLEQECGHRARTMKSLRRENEGLQPEVERMARDERDIRDLRKTVRELACEVRNQDDRLKVTESRTQGLHLRVTDAHLRLSALEGGKP